MLLCTAAFAQEQESKLGVTLDATYVGRHIDKGFDCYKENHSAIQPSIDLNLYDTGFGVKIWNCRTNGGGAYENTEKIKYILYYRNGLFENESYNTHYKAGWIYYNFPDEPKEAKDAQELFASFSWPRVLPEGLVPGYTVICRWPSVSNSAARNSGGWVHIFALGYNLTAPPLPGETTERTFHLSANVWYNDGLGGPNVDHDWSHATFGVSTKFDIDKNLALTPGIYYQASMDDSVNTSDEIWFRLSMTYKF